MPGSVGAIHPQLWDMVTDPSFNMFYNAGTLILICAKSSDQAAAEDCCLAARNLMLAACDLGLATCPIGFARSRLNLPDVKEELGIPVGYAPITPFIVGYPAETPPPVARLEPEILIKTFSWQSMTPSTSREDRCRIMHVANAVSLRPMIRRHTLAWSDSSRMTTMVSWKHRTEWRSISIAIAC